jgi:addiction module HigA family antidote
MSNSLIATEDMPDVVKDSLPPGEILKREFLEPYGVSQYRLARAIGVTAGHLSKVVHGQRSITVDLSVRLSRFFGTSPLFFIRLQNNYDCRLAQARLANVDIQPL